METRQSGNLLDRNLLLARFQVVPVKLVASFVAAQPLAQPPRARWRPARCADHPGAQSRTRVRDLGRAPHATSLPDPGALRDDQLVDMRHIGAAGSSRITPVPNDDLELRLTTLEHEVTRLREETAAARALAALADRDVAEFRTELRGHHHVLEALRETQLEQGQKIAEQGQKLDEQGRDMREGFATLATGMAQITALLTRIAGSERDGS